MLDWASHCQPLASALLAAGTEFDCTFRLPEKTVLDVLARPSLPAILAVKDSVPGLVRSFYA